MNLMCKLFGCVCHEYVPECVRCQAHIYDADYHQEGMITGPIWRLRWWLTCNARRVFRRCQVCRKGMWFKPHDCTCSEKCLDEWLPF